MNVHLSISTLSRLSALALVLILTACVSQSTVERSPHVEHADRRVASNDNSGDDIATPVADIEASEGAGDVPECGLLEIHYINVGQGASTFIRGPNGTTVLYDIGHTDDGDTIADYLEVVGVPQNKLDYVILSHRHNDHMGGYEQLLARGFDVKKGNLDSLSYTPPFNKDAYKRWWKPALTTVAGKPKVIEVGKKIGLGCDARIVVAAAGGRVLDGSNFSTPNENDPSISLLIQYGKFSMTLDGDLGSGSDACTGTVTPQSPAQQQVMAALIAEGYVDEELGIDVLHVAHHGSHSSSSPAYYNLAKPEVALMSLGFDDGNKSHEHPRKQVVRSVLLGPHRPACVTAPPVEACFQTEDGRASSVVSNACISAGDIVLSTDGETDYSITGNNRVTQGTRKEFSIDDGPTVFTFDEDAGAGDLAPLDPFFDNLDNLVATQNSPIPLADVTPIPPQLPSLDAQLVALCGDFGSSIQDLEEKLAAVLNAHPDDVRWMDEQLKNNEIDLGSGASFAQDMATLWMAQDAFSHVFCGERTGGPSPGIGGLHFSGRLLDLQTRTQAGRGEGSVQANARGVIGIPVVAHCGSTLCSAKLKSYAKTWQARDILIHGLKAWFQAARPGPNYACTYTADGIQATFVSRESNVRTFYPVVSASPQLPLCLSAEEIQTKKSAPASRLSRSISVPSAEECGE